jgi:hypothetical protein
MVRPKSPSTLRPLAAVVAALTLAVSTVLLSAAQVGSPRVSGYGVDHGPHPSSKLASR